MEKEKSAKTKMPSKGKAPKKSPVVNETNRIVDQGGGIIGDQATEREFEENFESAFSISKVAEILGIEEDRFIDFLKERGARYREGKGMPIATVLEVLEVLQKGGAPLIEELKAKDAFFAIKVMFIEIIGQFNRIVRLSIAVNNQITALNNEITKVQAAYVRS